jgi:hypothetical protein
MTVDEVEGFAEVAGPRSSGDVDAGASPDFDDVLLHPAQERPRGHAARAAASQLFPLPEILNGTVAGRVTRTYEDFVAK